MSAVFMNPTMTLIPAQTGRLSSALAGVTLGVYRLPTDPVGYVTATFDGVNPDCEIRVYRLTGEELAGIEVSTANQTLVWAVYSSSDTVVVRIVGLAYKTKEFQLNVSKGALAIPVQQEPDKWYRNPT